jgi:hypothetical protein
MSALYYNTKFLYISSFSGCQDIFLNVKIDYSMYVCVYIYIYYYVILCIAYHLLVQFYSKYCSAFLGCTAHGCS